MKDEPGHPRPCYVSIVYPDGETHDYTETIDWSDEDEARDILSLHSLIAAVDAMRACDMPWSKSWLYYIADRYGDAYTNGGGRLFIDELVELYKKYRAWELEQREKRKNNRDALDNWDDDSEDDDEWGGMGQ